MLPTALTTHESPVQSKLIHVDKANLTVAFGHYLYVSILNTSILHIVPE